MTREEQLMFCKKCLNRKMDLKQGIICNLTGQKASFENECPEFKLDDSVKIAPLDNKEGLQSSELKQKLSPEIFEKLKMEQNLTAGIVSGLVVGVIGAILWGVLTVLTGFQIGYMALAVGAGVGLVIRKFGNGVEPVFGYLGAGIALLSVIFGNFLSIIGFFANAEGLGYLETLFNFDYSYLPDLMAETFSLIDLLFYGMAVYEGYRFSFRLITQKSLQELRAVN
jgi:hypothetical protein